MTEHRAEVLLPIFKEFSVLQKKLVTEQITYCQNLITNTERVISTKISETISLVEIVISDYQEESKRMKEKNKTHSILFNPLTFFSIGETMHSFLIANLINPKAEHGQGDLFLKSFLNLLNIEVFENDNWIVSAEKGRIDILLKRKYPHTIVVIENKSNYATDQDNQLYRYWFQEIYTPNFKKFGDKTIEQTSNNNNYQVIYLTPSDWKLPSDNTMKKPKEYDIALPETIPIKPKIWLFNKQIVQWLNESSQQLHKDNHRLREYLKQYIELWT